MCFLTYIYIYIVDFKSGFSLSNSIRAKPTTGQCFTYIYIYTCMCIYVLANNVCSALNSRRRASICLQKTAPNVTIYTHTHKLSSFWENLLGLDPRFKFARNNFFRYLGFRPAQTSLHFWSGLRFSDIKRVHTLLFCIKTFVLLVYNAVCCAQSLYPCLWTLSEGILFS